MKDLVLRLARRFEQTWLRRWHAAPRLKPTRINLKLDLSTASAAARAQVEFSFRPQVEKRTLACLIGDARIASATCQGKPIDARVNAPFLILKFPKALPAFVEATVQLKYTYMPDQYGTILLPVGREDCPTKVTVTCRRPYLAVVQGKLVNGTENPPLRTYEWTPPRSRKLNAVVANLRSFKKATSDGMTIWLHLHAHEAELAPRILDFILELYRESSESNHRKLPYQDYHVVESDDPRTPAFNSAGLIVVPRGTFSAGDKPTVYGILAPELNKEWRRDPTRMVATGRKD